MRKIIAAINMTLDGFCDHTSMIADQEIHQYYTDLLNSADTILYGRITYQLMESYWPGVVKNPTGNKSLDDFALAIENISKIVFSHTLKTVAWDSARLAKREIKEEILELRQSRNGGSRDILVGSRSLIIKLLNLDLIDEFQLCIQPIIAGTGLSLFDNIDNRINLKLLDTKIFKNSGSVVFYYQPARN